MRTIFAVLCGMLAIAPAAARAKDAVRIAFVGPLTGGNSAIGLGGRNSVDLFRQLFECVGGLGHAAAKCSAKMRQVRAQLPLVTRKLFGQISELIENQGTQANDQRQAECQGDNDGNQPLDMPARE